MLAIRKRFASGWYNGTFAGSAHTAIIGASAKSYLRVPVTRASRSAAARYESATTATSSSLRADNSTPSTRVTADAAKNASGGTPAKTSR